MPTSLLFEGEQIFTKGYEGSQKKKDRPVKSTVSPDSILSDNSIGSGKLRLVLSFPFSMLSALNTNVVQRMIMSTASPVLNAFSLWQWVFFVHLCTYTYIENKKKKKRKHKSMSLVLILLLRMIIDRRCRWSCRCRRRRRRVKWRNSGGKCSSSSRVEPHRRCWCHCRGEDSRWSNRRLQTFHQEILQRTRR